MDRLEARLSIRLDPGSGAAQSGLVTTPSGPGTMPSGSGTAPSGSGTAPSGSETAPSGSRTAPPGAGVTPSQSWMPATELPQHEDKVTRQTLAHLFHSHGGNDQGSLSKLPINTE